MKYKPVGNAFLGVKLEQEYKSGKLVVPGSEDDTMWLKVIEVSDENKDERRVNKGQKCLVMKTYCVEIQLPDIGACYIGHQEYVQLIEKK